MDDMRNRYRMPRKDFGQTPPPRPGPSPPLVVPELPTTVHDSLKHAYQPPPQAAHQARRPQQPPARSPEPTIQRPKTKPARKKRHLVKNLFIIALILAILGGAGAWAYPKYAYKNPFPADIRSNASVGLFYPSKLPPGYKIDSSTIHLDNSVLTYAANNGPTRLVFTAQKSPPLFDFNTFYKNQFKSTQEFISGYGRVVFGKNDNRCLGSLVTNDTWLLLSTNSTSVTCDNMSLVLHNLKKY